MFKRWRLLFGKSFLAPALLGFAAVGLVLLLAKDTKVFINERIAYLSRPYEERTAEKLLKKQQRRKKQPVVAQPTPTVTKEKKPKQKQLTEVKESLLLPEATEENK